MPLDHRPPKIVTIKKGAGHQVTKVKLPSLAALVPLGMLFLNLDWTRGEVQEQRTG